MWWLMKQPSSSYSNFPSHFTSMKREEHTSCGRMEQLSGSTSGREMLGLTLVQDEFWQLEMLGRQLPSLQFIMEIFLTSIHYLVDTDSSVLTDFLNFSRIFQHFCKFFFATWWKQTFFAVLQTHVQSRSMKNEKQIFYYSSQAPHSAEKQRTLR